MTFQVRSINALEILDSRGIPTIDVRVELDNGIISQASVPSGLSTGKKEAVELRDHDQNRYNGKGVLKAVQNINKIIAYKLKGSDPCDQTKIDHILIDLDGTPDKSNLGANAIIGVSLAIARAGAKIANLPLYKYMAPNNKAVQLPMPMVNILNGGKHADNDLDFQEYMIVPIGAPTFSSGLRYCAEVFHSLKKILKDNKYTTNVGDEGGFAPKMFFKDDEVCDLLIDAIKAAYYKPGRDVAIAIDSAASSFYENNKYHLHKSNRGFKTSAEMTSLYRDWIHKYPIVSIEDGLAEDDWEGFREQTSNLGDKIQIVGDDIFCTNKNLIARGIQENTCNAALIKLNQIGTVTETMDAIELCRRAGWHYVISHRSGETNDAFIADFAVAMGATQIKTGSVCRGERISKYNRLLEIDAELGEQAIFENPYKRIDYIT